MTDKDKMWAFSAEYPLIDWVDEPTELNTRQMAFSRGWQAAKESDRKELEAAKQRIADLEVENEALRWDGALNAAEEKTEALEKKLAEQQAILRLANTAFDRTASEFRSGYLNGGSVKTSDLRVEAWRAVANCESEELTKLLAAARKEGFEEGKQLRIADYEEVLTDYKRLVRDIDVMLNGEAGAAKQASLCDIVAQLPSVLAKFKQAGRDWVIGELNAGRLISWNGTYPPVKGE